MATAVPSTSSLSVIPVSHPTTSSAVEKINVACRFFPIGTCRFNEHCRYLHVDEPAAVFAVPLDSLPKSSLNILAPVFVPQYSSNINTIAATPPSKCPSYAEVVNSDNPTRTHTEPEIPHHGAVLCPYLMKSGICRGFENCAYDHGELCELCGKYCLDPLDIEQRKKHNTQCIAQHEREMEVAFAIQRSKEKTCGICFDIVWEKEGREQRFGILTNCNHCFCLECIRRWRQAKQFDNKIIRSCPECRVCSDFVCPSSFWVDTSDEKQKLIEKYKKALSEKDCKYFKKGTGRCPFGNRCFYKHTLPNGQVVDVGEPTRPERRFNSAGNLERLQNLLFWDYLEERVQIIGEDLYLSDDSDESNMSDFLDFY